MEFSIVGERDPFLHVTLERGEVVHAESNAMVSMDATLDLKAQMQGGLLSALGRKFANGESFFNQHIEAKRGKGEILLAPLQPGDVEILEVGEVQYLLNDGAFLASETTVDLKVKMQGLGKAFFGGTGGFFVMQTAGKGKLAVAGFGSIFGLSVTSDNDVVIDNQHVIAWDSRLKYDISMSTSKSKGLLGNLVNSVVSGEGLVTRFSGQGKVYVSSRNIGNFISHIGTKLGRGG
jgi:uncharacterized protein (TIGR00266 family)